MFQHVSSQTEGEVEMLKASCDLRGNLIVKITPPISLETFVFMKCPISSSI